MPVEKSGVAVPDRTAIGRRYSSRSENPGRAERHRRRPRDRAISSSYKPSGVSPVGRARTDRGLSCKCCAVQSAAAHANSRGVAVLTTRMAPLIRTARIAPNILGTASAYARAVDSSGFVSRRERVWRSNSISIPAMRRASMAAPMRPPATRRGRSPPRGAECPPAFACCSAWRVHEVAADHHGVEG